MIESFQGPYRFLSNFWPVFVVLDGADYVSVEHAYQAVKTLDQAERDHIRRAGTPGEAKRCGRRATIRLDWEDIKLAVMEDLLRQKFATGTPLAQRLTATGDEQLVEGNTWGDRFWGVCRGEGHNHLGRLLMKVRTDLDMLEEAR